MVRDFCSFKKEFTVRSIRNVLMAVVLLMSGLTSIPSSAQGFLDFPLHGCSDPSCVVNYTTHGAYSASAMNSVLDHSMKLNPLNSYYPYGTTKTSHNGGDLTITAFNGESVGTSYLSGDERCIQGTINLHPDWNPSLRMTNDVGCGSNFSSYDEHPGYDYFAVTGTPVYTAAAGNVISTICYLGNTGSGTCADWGALAINHGNGYFSQYFHMNTTISVVPGQFIPAGTQIGTVGGRCGSGCTLGAHLHFEVRHIGPTIGAEVYPIVDPYGWVGGGTDPLYSASVVAPANLWK